METQQAQKDDNSKEAGNAHYTKKELDLAIQKYDEVILTQKMAEKLTPKN